MKFAITILLAAMGAATANAQSQSQHAIDLRPILDNLSAQSKRLIPILEQIDPNVWITAKGAPDQYVHQWRSSQDQLKAILTDTTSLSKEPEKLSAALQTYFRVQAVQTMLQSLVEGIRRYQNSALA